MSEYRQDCSACVHAVEHGTKSREGRGHPLGENLVNNKFTTTNLIVWLIQGHARS